MKPQDPQSLTIRTPEGIVFPLILASPASRFLALALDMAAILVIGQILGGLCMVLLPIGGASLTWALQTVMYFAVSIGYGMFMEWFWRGQTLGKRVLGLRVMDEQGLHLSGNQIIIRNLLRFVDMLPGQYMLGGLACLFSPKCQRLGDMAANTVVIRTPKAPPPDLDQIMEGKYNSLRDHPHIAARLRQGASKELAGIALAALLRRDALNPRDRLELFQAIASRLREAAAFPQEAVEGLSDEQYVRNAVDILFRS